MTELSPQAAIVYVMVTIASADLKLVDPELKRIGAICDVLPLFDSMSRDELKQHSDKCISLLSQDNGIANVISLIKTALPKRLYPTAYALALDIAASDLAVPAAEITFLQLLGNALGIDKLTVAALETSAQVRARRI